jgi:hypothetical protein
MIRAPRGSVAIVLALESSDLASGEAERNPQSSILNPQSRRSGQFSILNPSEAAEVA